MSSEQIIAAIQACAHELGRAPTRDELNQIAGISRQMVRHAFGGIARALRQAGLEPVGRGHVVTARNLLFDWALAVRKLGSLPHMPAYEQAGKFSRRPFIHRFRSWLAVPAAFRELAQQEGLETEWKDVLDLITASPVTPRKPPVRSRVAPARPVLPAAVAFSKTRPGGLSYRKNCFRDRPVAGAPLDLEGLAHEPVNELGVVFLFGMLAHSMGFRILSFQQVFPDCEAMREVQPGKWQRVRIEFEYESRNFRRHRHDQDRCDMIVCWRHNWHECPRHLEVVELSKALPGLM